MDKVRDGTTEAGQALTRITVNLTPRAIGALHATMTRTGDSKTDTINRALLAYDVVLELMRRSGGQLVCRDREGRVERIHLL